MRILVANKLGALGAEIHDRTELALESLSPSAAAVLSMLHFKSALTTTGLADVVGISQPTAVRLIDGLERQGLITRGVPAGRITPLSLTKAGHARAKRLQARRMAALDELPSVLTSGEREEFEEKLDRILAAATTSRPHARSMCRLCEHDLCANDHCPVGGRAAEIEK